MNSANLKAYVQEINKFKKKKKQKINYFCPASNIKKKMGNKPKLMS